MRANVRAGMADQSNHTEHMLAQLAFEWLQIRTGGAPSACTPSQPGIWTANVAGYDVAVAVEPVSSATVPPSWPGRVESFAARLGSPGGGATIVWVPAGAELP